MDTVECVESCARSPCSKLNKSLLRDLADEHTRSGARTVAVGGCVGHSGPGQHAGYRFGASKLRWAKGLGGIATDPQTTTTQRQRPTPPVKPPPERKPRATTRARGQTRATQRRSTERKKQDQNKGPPRNQWDREETRRVAEKSVSGQAERERKPRRDRRGVKAGMVEAGDGGGWE
ncbi:hypothetical protein HNY73_007123 [Argiope bruennichi]|uniref:Uncharacterized protein n=1 Tax=Argiope bruennichi TaxID=94029 RepID=A0A8T0FG08_ARGBR|nr:hypothetical protein HNY73_007123 [Argiope bruennichi]